MGPQPLSPYRARRCRRGGGGGDLRLGRHAHSVEELRRAPLVAHRGPARAGGPGRGGRRRGSPRPRTSCGGAPGRSTAAAPSPRSSPPPGWPTTTRPTPPTPRSGSGRPSWTPTPRSCSRPARAGRAHRCALQHGVDPRAPRADLRPRRGRHLIDGAVYTCEIPWTKPHPEAFLAAMRAVGATDPARASSSATGSSTTSSAPAGSACGRFLLPQRHPRCPTWTHRRRAGRGISRLADLDGRSCARMWRDAGQRRSSRKTRSSRRRPAARSRVGRPHREQQLPAGARARRRSALRPYRDRCPRASRSRPGWPAGSPTRPGGAAGPSSTRSPRSRRRRARRAGGWCAARPTAAPGRRDEEGGQVLACPSATNRPRVSRPRARSTGTIARPSAANHGRPPSLATPQPACRPFSPILAVSTRLEIKPRRYCQDRGEARSGAAFDG